MDHNCYFWKDGQVLVEPNVYSSWGASKLDVLDCFCVDASCVAPYARYGKYPTTTKQWVTVPLSEFPKEFRMHLLLMGVT